MSDLLFDKVQEIQIEYLNILKATDEMLFVNDEDTDAIFDEICVFWNRNKHLIELFIFNYCSQKDTYFYTAAVELSLSEKAHYAFLTYGKHHIWDDPLYSYINVLKTRNKHFNAVFKKQIKYTIKNSIEILEQVNNQILILPLRLLCEQNWDYYSEIVEKLFLSMFNSDIKLKDFLKLNDIEVIESLINENARNFIVFEWGEKQGTLCERYRRFIETGKCLYDKTIPASQLIYMHILGYWMQVLHILDIAQYYDLIPILRNELSMFYFVEINNRFKILDEDKVILKSLVAYVQLMSFDYYEVKFSLEDYLMVLKEFQYEEKVYNDLWSLDVKDRLSINNISTIQSKLYNNMLEERY